MVNVFCKDCKHLRLNLRGTAKLCAHPTRVVTKIDPITGRKDLSAEVIEGRLNLDLNCNLYEQGVNDITPVESRFTRILKLIFRG